jgi:hypothetical protein
MSIYSTFKGGSADPDTKDIVQMQVAEYVNRSAHIATSSTGRLYSGLELNITPRYQDSTIKIKVISNMTYGRGASALQWSLYRTIDGVGAYSVYDTRSGENWYGMYYSNYDAWQGASAIWYEQPNTTSQINYKVYYNEYTNSSVAYFAHQGLPCYLQAIEIKA